MNNPNPTLRRAHKILKKIVKKLGNPNLYFSAQVGVVSDRESTDNTFAAMIAPPRDGLAPVTFAASNKEEFIQKLNDFLKNKTSPDQVEVAFHEAQIEANNRSIEYHNEQIEAIKNPQPEVAESEVVETEGEAAPEEPTEPQS